MRELRVGDRVKVIGVKTNLDLPIVTSEEDIEEPEEQGFIGTYRTISEVRDVKHYKYTLTSSTLVWCDEELKLIPINNCIGGKLIKGKDDGKKK